LPFFEGPYYGNATEKARAVFLSFLRCIKAFLMLKTLLYPMLVMGCLQGNSVLWGVEPAPEYRPPSTPELYEKEPAPGPAPKIPSSLYAGFNLGIGQSRPSGTGNDKGAYLLSPKIGYNKTLTTWSLFDADLDFLYGNIGHSAANITIDYGALLRVGYGYSLGNRVFGIWKAGLGIYNADYALTSDTAYKAKGILGSVYQVAFEALFPITSSVALTASAQWNYFALSVNQVKSGALTKPPANDEERIQVILADVGIRVYL
jgi:hypothetical protein